MMTPFQEVMGMGRGYWASRILLTAVELDLFTLLDGSTMTAEQVAATAKLSPRGTAILLDALAAMGLLSRQGDLYALVEGTGSYLSESRKENKKGIFLHQNNLWAKWSQLTRVVREGKPAELDLGPEYYRHFILAMHHLRRDDVEDLVRAAGLHEGEVVLDLGGGPGTFAHGIAVTNPDARVTVLDLPQALEVARELLPDDLCGGRITLKEADFLKDDIGSGYELVLASSIIHIYDDSKNQQIVDKSFASLVPGGKLALRDFILNEDGISPPQAAIFAVNMLVNTDGGKCYRESEVRAWLSRAGFENAARIDLPDQTTLIRAEKPG